MNNFFGLAAKLSEELNRSENLNNVLEYVFDLFKSELSYSCMGIALTDVNGSIYSKSIKMEVGFDSENEFAENILVLSSSSVRISKRFFEFSSEGILKSHIVFPLFFNEDFLGVMLFSFKKHNAYSISHIDNMRLIADCISTFIEQNSLLDDMLLTIVNGFSKLVEIRDIETGTHIARIQLYSKVIAEGMRKSGFYSDILDDQYIEGIYKFSPLHDIGKVSIPDSILLKPSRLLPHEFEAMKKHTIIGADVLLKTSYSIPRYRKKFFEICIQIAECHHEKYNGKGYPNGFSGDNIPLCARIVAIADVFDALTTKRPYKKAYDLTTSFQIIKDDSGESFDPFAVQSFLEQRDEILRIYRMYKDKNYEVVNAVL